MSPTELTRLMHFSIDASPADADDEPTGLAPLLSALRSWGHEFAATAAPAGNGACGDGFAPFAPIVRFRGRRHGGPEEDCDGGRHYRVSPGQRIAHLVVPGSL